MEESQDTVIQDRNLQQMLLRISGILRRCYGLDWPNNYCTFDIETTGSDRAKDVILEWGHVLVKDGKVVDSNNVVLNWFAVDSVPHDWLLDRLDMIAGRMRHTGRSWRLSAKVLKDEGVSPAEVLPFIHEFLSSLKAQDYTFVAHNGWNFDIDMIQAHFKQDLSTSFMFDPTRVIDTGAVVKAMQMPEIPAPKTGEDLRAYFKRIIAIRAPGVRWNLDGYVFSRFEMEKRGMKLENAHTAGADAMVLHHLMQVFHGLIAQAGNLHTVIPAVAVPWTTPPAPAPSPAAAPPRLQSRPAHVTARPQPSRTERPQRSR